MPGADAGAGGGVWSVCLVGVVVVVVVGAFLASCVSFESVQERVSPTVTRIEVPSLDETMAGARLAPSHSFDTVNTPHSRTEQNARRRSDPHMREAFDAFCKAS